MSNKRRTRNFHPPHELSRAEADFLLALFQENMKQEGNEQLVSKLTLAKGNESAFWTDSDHQLADKHNQRPERLLKRADAISVHILLISPTIESDRLGGYCPIFFYSSREGSGCRLVGFGPY